MIPRLDEPVDVAAVQLVVPPGPTGSTHAAIRTIGSIRYGTGRRASSSRRPRIQRDPCRSSDQCNPAGVTSRPCRSRMATGRMWRPTSRPACVKVMPPSGPRRGTPLVASSRQLHVRAPWRRSTVRNCSARLIPKRIDSRPKLVARATPFPYRRHAPFPVPRDASATVAAPTCASTPRRSIESVAPVASRRSSEASERGAPSARSTNVGGGEPGRDGARMTTAPTIAAPRTRTTTGRGHPLRGVRRCSPVGSQWSTFAKPCRAAASEDAASAVFVERLQTFSAETARFPTLKDANKAPRVPRTGDISGSSTATTDCTRSKPGSTPSRHTPKMRDRRTG